MVVAQCLCDVIKRKTVLMTKSGTPNHMFSHAIPNGRHARYTSALALNVCTVR